MSTYLGSGMPRQLTKYYFWMCLLWCFWMGFSTWIGRLNKAHCPHQCRWALSNPLRAWIEQKGSRRRADLLSAWTGTPIFSYPQKHQCSCFSGIWTLCRTYCSVSLVLGPLSLDWNYTTSFPGLPAYRGLLCLHNSMSQSLIINLLCVYIYPIGYLSLENPDTVLLYHQ